MWTVKDDSGKIYKLTPNLPFLIGRNAGDLILKTDASISRNHAKITILESSNQCVVTDLKSKYGTYLIASNSDVIERITDNYIIKPNDRIRFGLQNSILTFSRESFVILTSSLTKEDKQALERLIPSIGGEIVTEWSEKCTHLTVSNSKLTAKLSCAMAAAIPIVKLNFWIALKEAKENDSEPPNPRDYCPTIEDSMLHSKNSLLPMESRKSIFKNLLFVHFRHHQLAIYKTMIELAGGKCVFYGSKDFNKKLLGEEMTRLVLFSEDDSQAEPYKVPSVTSVQKFLKKYKRRMIPDCEIPLGILYSSVEKYCNPNFSYETLLKPMENGKKIDLGETLAPETQDFLNSGDKERRHEANFVIPESVPYSNSESMRNDDGKLRKNLIKVEKNLILNDNVTEGNCEGKNSRKRASDNDEHGVSSKRLRADGSPKKNHGNLGKIEDRQLKMDVFMTGGGRRAVDGRENKDNSTLPTGIEDNRSTRVPDDHLEENSCVSQEERLKMIREQVFSCPKDEKGEVLKDPAEKPREMKKMKIPKTIEKNEKIVGKTKKDNNKKIVPSKSSDLNDKKWKIHLDGEYCGIPLRELAESRYLRRELFTGGFIGKKFEKQPVIIPKRIKMLVGN